MLSAGAGTTTRTLTIYRLLFHFPLFCFLSGASLCFFFSRTARSGPASQPQWPLHIIPYRCYELPLAAIKLAFAGRNLQHISSTAAHKDAQSAPVSRRHATLNAHLGRILYTPLDVKSSPNVGMGIRRRQNRPASSVIWYSGLNQHAFRAVFFVPGFCFCFCCCCFLFVLFFCLFVG